MASEIRVDKITSLSGVGTISPSPTGVEIAGITTVSTLKVGTGLTASSDGDIFATGVTTTGSLVSSGAISGTTGTFTVGTNKNAKFYAASHNDETDLGAGLGFSRQSDGAELISGIFGHSNSGLGVAARDHITFLTGGTSNVSDTEERFRINSSGLVGIGTASPTAKLSVGNVTGGYMNADGIQVNRPHSLGLKNGIIVYSDAGYNPTASYRAAAFKAVGTTGAALGISTDQGSNGLGGTLNARIGFDGGGHFLGNIGIGTDSSATILHVQANVGDMLRLDRQNNAGGTGNQIAFRHNNATGTSVETGAINCVITANADSGQLRFYTKESGGSNTEKLRIMPAGGMTFNGDTAYANALDDYEEGLHTVTITCNTSGTITLNTSHNKLAYHKIGDWINVHGRVRVSSVSSPSGQQLRVSLPYQAASEYGGDASRIYGVATIENADENQINYGIQPTYAGNSFVQVGNINTNTTNPSNVCSQVNSNSLIAINVTYRTV